MMEAIDTVMSDEKTIKLIVQWRQAANKTEPPQQLDVADLAIAVRDAQAEISFKAGEDQGYKNGRISGYNEATQKGIKAMSEALVAGAKLGRKEVVDAIKIYDKNYAQNDWGNSKFRESLLCLVNTKLKEWGL